MKLFLKNEPCNPIESYLLNIRSIETVKLYTIILKSFAQFTFKTKDLPSIDWSKLNRISILKFIHFKSETIAFNTANLYLQVLKGVAKECYLYRVIDLSCYEQISVINKFNGERNIAGRALNLNEIKRIKYHYANCHTNSRTRDCAIFALACGAGLRRSELSRLDVTDIHYNSISVKGKGNKSRTVYMNTFVKSSVNRWIMRTERRKGPLFTHISRGDRILQTRLLNGGIHSLFIRMTKELKLKHFSAHDLRRTFATMLLDKNADRFAVQRLMGHSSLATTELYDRRGEKAKVKAINLLPF
ncbi:tyrosine-type recombinase/integrase [Thalassotalea piscium]|uniref:Integrase n=1 Tax=Thalassotalea piscium TaxID=1230533 RepID=A0A7X0TT94_9GAMM|nr:site-specific integrase [Thalassotalea piscium]MBB6542850.1 integrase [Thalassotalea piscium]